MAQTFSPGDISMILSFVVGFGLVLVLVPIPECLRRVDSRRLSPSEFEATIRWGRVKSVSALMVYIMFFGVAAALVIAIAELNGKGWVLFLLFPGAFFLTMELPTALLEVAWEVAPRFTKYRINFEVGQGLRRRGLLRGAIATSFIAIALVVSIMRWL
jgi:hypothetical protein